MYHRPSQGHRPDSIPSLDGDDTSGVKYVEKVVTYVILGCFVVALVGVFAFMAGHRTVYLSGVGVLDGPAMSPSTRSRVVADTVRVALEQVDSGILVRRPARLFLPANDISRLESGQHVELQFVAGGRMSVTMRGEVVEHSASLPPTSTLVTNHAARRSHAYAIRLEGPNRLDDRLSAATGEFRARISIGRTTLLSWAFDRLYRSDS